MKRVNQNVSSTPQKEAVPSVGADLGGKLGCAFSVVYCIVGITIELLLQNTGTKDIASLFAMNILLVLFFASFPSTILGLTTGFFIGVLSKIFSHRISNRIFIVLCSTICVAIIILLHLLIFDFSISTYKATIQESYLKLGMLIIDKYYYLIGIPSIIYIMSGGWIGKILHSKQTEH